MTGKILIIVLFVQLFIPFALVAQKEIAEKDGDILELLDFLDLNKR